MKLDPTVMRSMNSQDFRVMEAVEKGMKDHAQVPLPLIMSIANLRHGGAHKIVSSLLRDKLLSHERKNGFDGYRLTNSGYDILALHNLKVRGFIAGIGQRIGTGKESDIYLAVDPQGAQIVLKFHRLGRTSFRNVKKKRDYFGKATQQAHSWLFLSRLSALKEFAFMKALYDVNYPTPTPVAHNRHIVAMSLVRGIPLYQVFPKQLSVEQAADIFEQSVALTARLARHGLVHCDLNEFNLLVDLSGIQALATATDDPYVRHSGMSVSGEKSIGALSKPAWEQSMEAGDRIEEAIPEPVARLPNGEPKPIVTLIDFPQMISVNHPNAQELYDRDVACLKRFFEVKLQCKIPDDVGIDYDWYSVKGSSESVQDRLDSELKASGASGAMDQDLELYYFQSGPSAVLSAVDEDAESDENDVEIEDKGSLAGSDSASEEVTLEEARLDEDPGLVVDTVPSDDAEPTEELGVSAPSVATTVFSRQMTREELEEHARLQVRRQLEAGKRKARNRGAFRKGNRSKEYVKGKRVFVDTNY